MTNFPKLHCLETSFRSNATDSTGMMTWGREAPASGERVSKGLGRKTHKGPSPAHTDHEGGME